MAIEFEKIIEKLHALTQVDVQNNWSVFKEDLQIHIDDFGDRYHGDRAAISAKMIKGKIGTE